jgi:hypothetical protein
MGNKELKEDYMYRMEAIKDYDPELFDTMVNLISKLNKQVQDLEKNTLRNFSVFMQNNIVWIKWFVSLALGLFSMYSPNVALLITRIPH